MCRYVSNDGRSRSGSARCGADSCTGRGAHRGADCGAFDGVLARCLLRRTVTDLLLRVATAGGVLLLELREIFPLGR